MKTGFCIFKFGLAVSLAIALVSCSRGQSDVSSTNSSSTQFSDVSPQTGSEQADTTPASEPGVCRNARTTSECELAKLQLSEIELKQVFDQLIDEIGSDIPIEGTEPLEVKITAAQQSWLGYRDKSCELQVALSQTGARAVRGNTLGAIGASCLMRMNNERIAQLSEITARHRNN